jgi:chromosome segregation ATPase
VDEEVPARGSAPTPDTGGDIGGTSSSIPPPAPEEMEVVFGRWLRSGAEQEATQVPLPHMLSRTHQVLSDTGAAILREWEVLEAEHQRLSDWRTQLEERTKTVSCQFISEWSQLERDRKEYYRDLQKVCARELEASWREKKVTRREEALTQREALTTEYQAKLNALDQNLEAQRAQQVKAVERMRKWEQELEGKASDIALAEENLKVKEQSLDKREMDLARRETDLTFGEEMITR